MIYQWISWHQPTEDYRPLTFPPNENVLGWWRTGENASGDATIVALVKSNNEGAAKNIIKKDWPEAKEWRFCDRQTSTELSDRFVLEDWMKERFERDEK